MLEVLMLSVGLSSSEVPVRRRDDKRAEQCAIFAGVMTGSEAPGALFRSGAVESVVSSPLLGGYVFQAGSDKAIPDAFVQQLDRLEALPDGWDGDDAPKPEKSTVIRARRILSQAISMGVHPRRIVPVGAGGAALYFRAGEKYADLSFHNSGLTTCTLIRDRDEPISSPVMNAQTSIEHALSRIASFLAE